jgi:1-acyl-sn-glycerol-3-phosphate acyltransferase
LRACQDRARNFACSTRPDYFRLMFARVRAKQPGAGLAALAFYSLARNSSALVYHLIYRLRVEGRENVPASGPVILACNHQSNFDPPLVGSSIRQRNLDFIAKVELFKWPLSWVIRGLNSIPVKGDGGDTGSIKEVIARLERGRATLIFPEGSRTPDGEIKEFQRGVMLLVKRAKCPVVPCAIEGPFKAWPRGRALPTPFAGAPFRLKFGKPIAHEELMALGNDGALARLRREINALHEQIRG